METEIYKAVFIRHKMSSTTEILEKLWNKRVIAIHYENIRSTNPDDYEDPAAKHALNRLHTYCDQGAVVGAIYRQIRPAQILVGIIKKGSEIKIFDEYGDKYIYKTVQLQDTKEVSLLDYPLLGAIQPRLTAIARWRGVSDLLWRIASNQRIPENVKYLAPGQLEVVCQEYLRMKGILKFLLLPIGRNLQDIDIVGIGNDGGRVIAQVTQSKKQAKVDKKLRILENYKGRGVKLIFFGPKSCNITSGEVEYIPIETIIPALISSQVPIYSKAIDLLFNRESSLTDENTGLENLIMATNYLEQLIAEWYEYNGYFIRRNVLVGPRAKGGFEGELDIVAFHPKKMHLVHVEPSMDASSWAEREKRYQKKFLVGRKYIPQLFQGIKLPTEIEQIAVLVFASKANRSTLGGGRIMLIDELLQEIFHELRDKHLASSAIPEDLTVIRSFQFVAEYHRVIFNALKSTD